MLAFSFPIEHGELEVLKLVALHVMCVIVALHVILKLLGAIFYFSDITMD